MLEKLYQSKIVMFYAFVYNKNYLYIALVVKHTFLLC